MLDSEGRSYIGRLERRDRKQRFLLVAIWEDGVGRWKAQMSSARGVRLTVSECRSESIDSVKNDKTYTQHGLISIQAFSIFGLSS